MSDAWADLRERCFTGEAPVEAVRAHHAADGAGRPLVPASLHSTWRGPDGVDDPFTVGADDLVAVAFTGADLAPDAVLELLVDRRDAISSALATIPTGTPLWRASDADLAAAQHLWDLVADVPHTGTAFVSALVARKRPLLLPLGLPTTRRHLGDDLWRPLRTWTQDEANRTELVRIRQQAGLPDLPVLRVVDAVLAAQKA